MAAPNVCAVGIKSAYPDAKDSHQCALTSDKKLWLMGLKGVEQKKYSFYHRTALLGSYLAALNLENQTWEPLCQFGEIYSDENGEDILLAIGADLYMLVYSRYDGFEFRKLLVWSATEKGWKPVGSFTVDPETKIGSGRCQLVFVQDPNSSSVFFVVTAEGEGVIQISKLNIESPSSATISHVMSISSLEADLLRGRVTLVGFYENTLFGIAGEEMCGFHWQPKNIIQMDLSAKKFTATDTSDTKPPFAFSGPHETVQLKDGRWIMVGGSLAKGMTNTEFSGEMWAMDFKKKNEGLKWEKLEHKVPGDLKDHELCVASDGVKIYLADTEKVKVLEV